MYFVFADFILFSVFLFRRKLTVHTFVFAKYLYNSGFNFTSFQFLLFLGPLYCKHCCLEHLSVHAREDRYFGNRREGSSLYLCLCLPLRLAVSCLMTVCWQIESSPHSPPDESSCNFKRRYALYTNYDKYLLMIMYIITSCKFIFLLLATSAVSSFCNDKLLALAFFNALSLFNFVTQIEVVVSLPLLRCSTAIIWLMRWSTSTMVVHYYEKTLSCYDSTGMTLALAWWQLTCWHSGEQV